jgi:hypothetical protein
VNRLIVKISRLYCQYFFCRNGQGQRQGIPDCRSGEEAEIVTFYQLKFSVTLTLYCGIFVKEVGLY